MLDTVDMCFALPAAAPASSASGSGASGVQTGKGGSQKSGHGAAQEGLDALGLLCDQGTYLEELLGARLVPRRLASRHAVVVASEDVTCGGEGLSVDL